MSTGTDTILRLEDLHYGYIDGQFKREILKGLSYDFKAGMFYTILGPSGSGKTTLLSIMAGLFPGRRYSEDRSLSVSPQ